MTDPIDAATAHAVATMNRIYNSHPHDMTMGELLRQAITETVPLIRTACRDEVIEELAREADDVAYLVTLNDRDPQWLSDWLRAQKGGDDA